VEANESPEVRKRFEQGLPLVASIARQVFRSIERAVELEELEALGREGLWMAAQRFDPSRGVPFRGFASFRVRGAMIDGVRQASHLPRRLHERLRAAEAALHYSEGAIEDVSAPAPPGGTRASAERALADHLAGMATAMAAGLVAKAAVADEGEPLAVSADTDPEGKVLRAQLVAKLAQAIDGLPDKEAELVRRHYFDGELFDTVARDLGLSKSWASRLHTRAIDRLTKRLRE
jgi:RNA polymerase sigma factor for flagellar operon FliA